MFTHRATTRGVISQFACSTTYVHDLNMLQHTRCNMS